MMGGHYVAAHASGVSCTMSLFIIAIMCASVAILSFMLSILAQLSVTESLESNYPAIFEKLNKPSPLWTLSRNFSFVFQFLLGNQYRRIGLDKNTLRWCFAAASSLKISILFLCATIIFLTFS